jgi:hypothetical protein
MTFQQGHADERIDIGGFDLDEARLAVPNHRGPIHVEQIHASVGKRALLTAQPSELKCRERRWPQSEVPSEPGVNDSVDLSLSGTPPGHRQPDERL